MEFYFGNLFGLNAVKQDARKVPIIAMMCQKILGLTGCFECA